MGWRYESTITGTEPLTLAEFKEHLHIDVDDENTMLNTLITSARQYVEDHTGAVLVDKTITISLNEPFVHGFIIPTKFDTINWIKFWDSEKTETTLNTDYYLEDSATGSVILVNDYEFPSDIVKLHINYDVSADDNIDMYVSAMKVYATAIYENREGIPQSDLIAINRHLAGIKKHGWQ